MQAVQYITLMNTLARFRLRAEARVFGLGYLWWILEPLMYVGVFYLVFVVLLGNRDPEFLFFLAVGKLTFIWFSKTVNQASLSLINSREVMAQTNLPKHLFPMAVIHEGLYRQTGVFAFLLTFLWMADFEPGSSWLWLIPVIVTQYLLVVGCGLFAAVLVCVKRDFQMLIQLGMVFLLFMSGVFWDVNAVSNSSLIFWLETLNPLMVLLNAYRQILLWDSAPNIAQLFIISVQAAIIVGVMIWLYAKLHFWLAERAITQ